MLISVLDCGQIGRVEGTSSWAEGHFTVRRALGSLVRRLTGLLVARAPKTEQPRAGGVMDEDLLDEMTIW